MLIELTIRQFTIIKYLKINFKSGLNILTGETGAGKSVIIDAIQLISGSRGSIDFIRRDSEKAEIEALFDLPIDHSVFKIVDSLGIPYSDDGLLILKRELLQSGKSICRINGQLVTLSSLKEVGQYLIQFHSQNQHQHLLMQDKQLALLDAYGDTLLEEVKTDYKQSFAEYIKLKKEYQQLAENEREMTQRIDLLQYQIKEISEAELKPGEDEDLIQQKNKIKYSEKILNSLNNTYQLLSEEKGIVDLLNIALGLLDQVTRYDSDISVIHEQLSSAYYQIEDLTMQISQKVDQLDFDPNQINYVEERLSLIHHLKRKYGDSVDAILEYATKIQNELDLIQNKDQHLQKIQTQLEKVTLQVLNKARKLSGLRTKIAEELSTLIEKELNDLQMKNTVFKVDIRFQEDLKNITPTGLDNVNFLISSNPGEPLKPLNKIASGGELSRIMLAIQTILADKDNVPIMVFDEIDTGVSGQAAQAIAEKLAYVARDKQVFVITHLPQVASMADHHYLIQKKVDGNSTFTEIEYLSEDKSVEEIARMLGGVEVTNLTRKHAKEMIKKTIPFKKNIRSKRN
ncbi:DNA repair protein RecN [Vulcanibacillus modesticaldus]|uniref:DNA repair protein RecN n=1 Tax=Vulcanibacillus modesticaldus TaxID=337097 RepID=A0A1D2YRV2_9BACI|nr:DNA repair protein RecN [Vulcanibacillus modesticaldus]OEF95528.1 DNA repair protein RecN [Vulcanibacillus modesticaldus]